MPCEQEMRICWDSCAVIDRIQQLAPWDSVIADILEPTLDVTVLHMSHLTTMGPCTFEAVR
jgi:hypothetical protein